MLSSRSTPSRSHLETSQTGIEPEQVEKQEGDQRGSKPLQHPVVRRGLVEMRSESIPSTVDDDADGRKTVSLLDMSG